MELFEDENTETPADGFSAISFLLNARQLNVFYRLNALYALPVSGDDTAIELGAGK